MSTASEREMLDRLNVRYGRMAKNGSFVSRVYSRAEHVPVDVGFREKGVRIADYVATWMHSPPATSWADRGPSFIGHEVKVSRSDWLTELRDPSKAEFWVNHCHYFNLVVSDESIVRRDELPQGWGLMVAHGSSVRVAVEAVRSEAFPMPLKTQAALLRATMYTEARLAAPSLDKTGDTNGYNDCA